MARNIALVGRLQELERHTLSALDATHDYFTHSKTVWLLLQQEVRKGGKFAIRSQTTGNQIHEQDLLAKGQVYLTDYLLPSTLQHLVSLFEHYVFELLRVWLTTHPQSLANKQVRFQTILESTLTTEIIREVVDSELNEVKYKGVADWFKYLHELVHLTCPAKDQIERLVETKASRDILVHNNGITNDVYIKKAGNRARNKKGERLEISEGYLSESWDIIRKVVQDLSAAAQTKA